MNELVASVREINKCHGCKELRRMGRVPGVLYGGNMREVYFTLEKNHLEKYMIRYGQHSVMNISIDGKNIKTLIKEVQRHATLNHITHIDLQRIE